MTFVALFALILFYYLFLHLHSFFLHLCLLCLNLAENFSYTSFILSYNAQCRKKPKHTKKLRNRKGFFLKLMYKPYICDEHYEQCNDEI